MIIDGKDIKLALNLEAYDKMCQKGYWVEEIDERLTGTNRVNVVCDLIAILGTCGTGEEIQSDLVKKTLPFSQFPAAKAEVVNCIVAAMRSETADADQADEVVDEVLEEIEKKKEKIG